MTVRVRVPIVDAVEWEPWLDSRLSLAASRAGLNYDGGEEESDFEVHAFFDGSVTADVDVVQHLVVDVLTKRKKARDVAVTGDEEVTVAEAASGHWLRVLAPRDHPYLRAVHRLTKSASDDPSLRDWWDGSGYKRLWFQLRPVEQPALPWFFSREPGQILFTLAQVENFSILDEERPSRTDVLAAAKQTVDSVLDHVATHLNWPLPS